MPPSVPPLQETSVTDAEMLMLFGWPTVNEYKPEQPKESTRVSMKSPAANPVMQDEVAPFDQLYWKGAVPVSGGSETQMEPSLPLLQETSVMIV